MLSKLILAIFLLITYADGQQKIKVGSKYPIDASYEGSPWVFCLLVLFIGYVYLATYKNADNGPGTRQTAQVRERSKSRSRSPKSFPAPKRGRSRSRKRASSQIRGRSSSRSRHRRESSRSYRPSRFSSSGSRTPPRRRSVSRSSYTGWSWVVVRSYRGQECCDEF